MQRALTSGPITGSILLGLCIGSGAAISMQYGSGEYDKMRQSVFQSFALIAGMALADAIGIGYYLVKHRKETLGKSSPSPCTSTTSMSSAVPAPPETAIMKAVSLRWKEIKSR